LPVPAGVPDDVGENIKEGILKLTRKDVLSLHTPLINAISDYLRESVKRAKENISAYYPEAVDTPVSVIVFTGGLANSKVIRDSITEFPFLRDIKRYFPSEEMSLMNFKEVGVFGCVSS
jgi:tRNA A37 threonylcarbamoyltransferase TsaD